MTDDRELTDDQIAYCHERAEATRAHWAAHARQMTDDERREMEKATQELDAEARRLLDERRRRRRGYLADPEIKAALHRKPLQVRK